MESMEIIPSQMAFDIELEKIYVEEEVDNFIYSVREELIDKVMVEIDKIDSKDRTVTFIVDIACEALWRLLNLEFIHHAIIPDIESPEWSGDAPAEPSPKDFLATKTIPIRIKDVEKEKESESVKDVVCECEFDKSSLLCECLLTVDEQNLQKPAKLEVSLTPSKLEIQQKYPRSVPLDIPDSPDINEQEASSQPVLQSLPSLVSEVSEESLEKNARCMLSEGFSKFQDTITPLKLPKVDLNIYTKKIEERKLVELPDIRAYVTREFHSDEDEKKEKLRKKKDKDRRSKEKKYL
ncbi:uncharacterized protein [Diabrotica undecimpunctata]|uniref:uncharacterized protein n=1 Tax=Diabrotica undecimpunctata TaxID=50387 RepID=UPI003B633B22